MRGRLAALGIALSATGGCALLAGYDFGRYHEGTTSSGAGGATSNTSHASSTSSHASSASGAGAAGTGGASSLVLYEGGNGPTSIALAGNRVYFATADDSAMNGEVRRVDEDGTNPTSLATSSLGAWAVAVDGVSVYWTTTDAYETTTQIWGADRDTGANPTIYATVQGSVQGLAAGGGYVYWVDVAAGTVERANTPGSGTVIVQDPSGPNALTLDGDGVYWAAGGTPTTATATISRANLDGTGALVLAVGETLVFAMKSDANNVYWGRADGAVNAVPKAGSGAVQALVPQSFFVQSLAVDATKLYLARYDDIERVSVSGAPTPEPFLTQLPGVRGLAVDASWVVYGQRNNGGTPNAVTRVAK